MRQYSKADIQRLGLTDPIVRAHLDAQKYQPGISWEQMLTSLVVHLQEAKAAAECLRVHREVVCGSNAELRVALRVNEKGD